MPSGVESPVVRAGTTSNSGSGTRRTVLKWLERLGVPIAWVIVIAIFGAIIPGTFLRTGTFATVLGSQAVLVILSLAVIIPLRAGDFDLSVAATMTLASVTVVVLNTQYSLPLLLSVFVCLVLGALIGLLNAGFMLIFGTNSLIVTLGVGQVVLGLALIVSQGQIVTGVSDSLTKWVVGTRLFGIPVEFYYAIALACVVWYLFDFTSTGRRILFVGVNKDLARLSGVRVGRVRLGALVAAGLLSGLAGVVYTGTSGSSDATSGATYLLPAFAAAFLGATTIVPGRFNPWGTVISAYFLATGITGFAMLGAGTFVQNLFYGGALLVAVSLSQLVRGRTLQEFN